MEQNLHSVFRLVDDKYEDLRKAVVEKTGEVFLDLTRDTESVTNGTVDDLEELEVEEKLKWII